MIFVKIRLVLERSPTARMLCLLFLLLFALLCGVHFTGVRHDDANGLGFAALAGFSLLLFSLSKLSCTRLRSSKSEMTIQVRSATASHSARLPTRAMSLLVAMGGRLRC